MGKMKIPFLKYWSEESTDHESNANRFTLKCQLLSLVLLLCMWVLNQLDIFILDKQIMNTCVITCCAIEVLIIIVCHIFGYEKKFMKYVILFFSVVMITAAGIFLTYHTLLGSVLPLLYSMQYRNKKVVYYTYILTFFSMMAIVLGGYYLGLCDANMLVLTTSSIWEYIDVETGAVLFEGFNQNPIATLPLFYVLPRMVVLLAMIPVMQHVVDTVTRHAAVQAELKRMGEMDQMTHMYNRNKYNQMLKEYFPKVDRVAVFFWDINGLKMTNDSLGHDAGDYVITIIAKTIFKIIGTNRYAYRIGGDEFVMIIENPKEQEIENLLEEWNRNMESMNRSSKIPLSASVGYAIGKGKDIEDIISRADHMMYEEKRKVHS